MELIEGVVLKTTKHQENSKLVTMLTIDGVETYVAKGALKLTSKNKSYTTEGSIVSFSFSQKRNSYKYITTGKVTNPLINFKMEPDKLQYLLLQFEILLHLGNHVTDKSKLFDLNKEILLKSEESKYSNYYFIIFALKMLYLLGVAPSFTKCVRCATKDNLKGFSFNGGGMICEDCSNQIGAGMLYNKDVIGVIRLLYLVKIDSIDEEFFIKISNIIKDYNLDMDAIFKFVYNYYDSHLGFKSSTFKLFNTL